MHRGERQCRQSAATRVRERHRTSTLGEAGKARIDVAGRVIAMLVEAGNARLGEASRVAFELRNAGNATRGEASLGLSWRGNAGAVGQVQAGISCGAARRRNAGSAA